MLWLKALHLIFMVTWFAGLFYLPRLFVYHTQVSDAEGNQRFKIMEKKLFAIMTMGGLLTIIFGVWLTVGYGMEWFRYQGWLHAKLTLVIALIAYHIWCGFIVHRFATDRNTRPERFYRMINEIPVIPLVGAIILAVLRPF
ncbi:CopD family protein [Permianibacter aggregans]|uniref:Protoporphyrinogen IX oxidase n=1 Tax=Permianibacter aggregans TaxID=1510150 RepID=A0A4R6ULI9_9GAMM|nr:CopD family protein [Permianibacter aggregans]QGX39209.1 CopD family protein [Permianibacter aggregans]TDQ46015.1 putative membrane protein [Permianibacter aggregans]